jgi:hypothetical protein
LILNELQQLTTANDGCQKSKRLAPAPNVISREESSKSPAGLHNVHNERRENIGLSHYAKNTYDNSRPRNNFARCMHTSARAAEAPPGKVK